MKTVVAMVAAGVLAGGVAAWGQAGPQHSSGKVCDVKTYGAKGDGTTKDTDAIKKALAACAGGGKVVLSGGKFVSGPLEIGSGITLDVEAGAQLLGSTDMADYKKATEMRQPTVEPFLHVLNADGVTITGGGIIDGQGQVWWDYVKGMKDAGVLDNPRPRPMLLLIDHSKNVTVEHVTVQNSGFWQIVPYYSQYLTFSHLKVLAPGRGAPNTDGIDPFSSSHILIDHYYASVGDDNIAIKSGAINSPGPDEPSTDITITDCEFHDGHGLSIGSEISGGVHGVHAERIRFVGTDQGIRVKANRDRGNETYDLSFKNIEMDKVKTAILISEYYPKVMPEGDVAAAPVGRLTPHFHDITIENVRSVNGGVAGVIVGLPESPVVKTTLHNVSLEAQKGVSVAYADVVFDHVKVTAAEGQPVVTGAQAKIAGDYATK